MYPKPRGLFVLNFEGNCEFKEIHEIHEVKKSNLFAAVEYISPKQKAILEVFIATDQ